MNMVLSARTRLSFGHQLPLWKFSSSRVATFHGSIWFRKHACHDDGPLTLSSLGFGNKVEVMKKEKSRRSEIQTSDLQVRSSRSPTVRLQKQVGIEVREVMKKVKTTNLEIQLSTPQACSSRADTVRLQKQVNTGVKEVKVQKNYKSSKLGDLSSDSFSKIVYSSKEKPERHNRSKAVSEKKVIDVNSAIFSVKSFSELDLSPLLIKRLDEEGLTLPTEVQSTAIPTILRNHDVVIQSYTGSGKTFSYLLPILSEVGPLKTPVEGEESGCKYGIEAVIVAPSRELGMQIVREVEKLLGSAGKIFVQQLVGGANRSRQEEALKKNRPAIVVGTPGRIAEISAAGKLHTHSCRFLVLDEVDQLLSFNFREDMHRILEHVGRRLGAPPTNSSGLLAKPVERQLIMVSATVPYSVVRAARSWGNDPLLVKAKNVEPLESISVPGTTASDTNCTSISSMVTQAAVDSLPPALKHYYCVSKGQHKVDMLRRCVHALDAKSVIAFMNHSKQLRDVVFKLEARGIKSAALHGDLGKLGRSTTLKNFKNGDLRVLVTNELSARGLDVFECDLVVNLDLPTDSVHYAHRAGRTGRLGQKGNVVTICEEPEVFVMNKLRRQLRVAIQACEFVEGKLIISKEEEEKA